MNFDRLRFVAERAELGEHHEALLAVTIPEARGSFKALCELIGPRNVTEFNYRIADAKAAHLFIGVGIKNRAEAKALVRHFDKHGVTSCLDRVGRHLQDFFFACLKDHAVFRAFDFSAFRRVEALGQNSV